MYHLFEKKRESCLLKIMFPIKIFLAIGQLSELQSVLSDHHLVLSATDNDIFKISLTEGALSENYDQVIDEICYQSCSSFIVCPLSFQFFKKKYAKLQKSNIF